MSEPLRPSGTSTWRGASGRLYACTVYPVRDLVRRGGRHGIALAIKRDGHGVAKPVSPPCPNISDPWLASARSDGATEVHVHELDAAGTAGVVIDDLRGG